MTDTSVLIVGGGLAGLALADKLARIGMDFLLLDGRDRLGGRALTRSMAGGRFDLGPAWFWPGQPRMAAMIERFDIKTFEQYSIGDQVIEDRQGTVHRGRGFAAMSGSIRIDGGFGRLVNALASGLPPDRIRLRTVVSNLEFDGQGLVVRTLCMGHEEVFRTKICVLALPPRLASARLAFSPDLSSDQKQAMQSLATWMGAQAKVIATFDKPYWRMQGYSGDAMSQYGPLVEIHDASPIDGGPYALFGFVGVPAIARQGQKEAILDQSRAQFERLFEGSIPPIAIDLKDWADDPLTATKLDYQETGYHPRYGHPKQLQSLWGGRLMLGSTEVASDHGGYVEGALEAAEIVMGKIAG